MAAAKKGKKKPKPRRRRDKCKECGAPTGGKSKICLTCMSKATPLQESKKAVVDRVRERLERGDLGGPVCPFCRVPIDWQNVGVIEEEITIYVREKIYFCPACRAFLGVASWHSEG